MKRIALIGLVLIALPGCAQENVKQALENIDKDCVRHYTFTLSSGMAGVVGNANVAGTIDCQPAGTTVTTTVAKPPAGSTP
jgi:hypothetical protein